jgi:hypothetical protein
MRVLSPRSVLTRDRRKDSLEPLTCRQAMRTFSPSCVTRALTPSVRSDSWVEVETLSNDAATTRSRLPPGPQVRHGLPGSERKLPDQTQPAASNVVIPRAQISRLAHDMGFLLCSWSIRDKGEAGTIASRPFWGKSNSFEKGTADGRRCTRIRKRERTKTARTRAIDQAPLPGALFSSFAIVCVHLRPSAVPLRFVARATLSMAIAATAAP